MGGLGTANGSGGKARLRGGVGAENGLVEPEDGIAVDDWVARCRGV